MQTAIRKFSRREFIRDAAALGAALGLGTANAAQRLRFMALGQAAIQYDPRQQPYPDFERLAALLKPSDICFTDLETAIAGDAAGKPTRNTGFIKVAQPVVLDYLKSLSVNLLALSNNHSWDLDTGGILSTLDAVRVHGFSHAGTGRNVTEATAPGYRDTTAGKVALVSMASGAIRPGAAATESRAGVNEVRLESNREINSEDAARNLESIAEAARNATFVFCYQHDHYWEKDFRITPDWKRGWARRCVSMLARRPSSVTAHLCCTESRFTGDGLFSTISAVLFFIPETAIGYYIPEVWESVIADCVFEDGKMTSMALIPIMLNERGRSAYMHEATRGLPAIARGNDAARILGRLNQLSESWGAEIRVSKDVGRLVI